MVRHIYKDVKYDNLFTLRQAIWESASLIFGDLTNDLKEQLGITEEEYNPEDEWTNDQWAEMVRRKRDSLISGTDYYILPDYPSTPEGLEAVKAYRQALRDITEQKGFPRNVEWPEIPNVLRTGESTLRLAKVGI